MAKCTAMAADTGAGLRAPAPRASGCWPSGTGIYAWPTILIVLKILAIAVPLLIAMAYLTYMERKVIAAMQLRKGPNVVGWFGLLQPFADGIKLLLKETVIPPGANPRRSSSPRR